MGFSESWFWVIFLIVFFLHFLANYIIFFSLTKMVRRCILPNSDYLDEDEADFKIALRKIFVDEKQN